MPGRIGAFVFFLLMTLVSCNDPVFLRVKPDVVEKGDTARKTLVVYMMAENSLNNYASLDVKEIMEAVPSIPRDCRLFVYVDDNKFKMITH